MANSSKSRSFTKLRVVSIEHLQWVWHASKERLPSWTPLGSVPLRDLHMLQLLRLANFPTFQFEYPSVLSRFCFWLTVLYKWKTLFSLLCSVCSVRSFFYKRQSNEKSYHTNCLYESILDVSCVQEHFPFLLEVVISNQNPPKCYFLK